MVGFLGLAMLVLGLLWGLGVFGGLNAEPAKINVPSPKPTEPTVPTVPTNNTKIAVNPHSQDPRELKSGLNIGPGQAQ